MMYRSDWGQNAGQERILRIWIDRTEWDNALSKAILSTPEPHVYSDAKQWRKQLEASDIRVQWDPERNLRNEKLPYRSIQVGIGPRIAEVYAKKWIHRIEDCTPLTRQIHSLCRQKDYSSAEKLLPQTAIYPATPEMRKMLGMN
jgi:hypothetical protein